LNICNDEQRSDSGCIGPPMWHAFTTLDTRWFSRGDRPETRQSDLHALHRSGRSSSLRLLKQAAPLKRKLLLMGLAVALAVAGIAAFVLNLRVDRALEAVRSAEQPVEFVPLPERSPLPFWGSEDVESVIALPGGLYVAGAFGVARLPPPMDPGATGRDRIDISMPLPTRRASAMSPWRGDLVAGLEQEGLFVYRDGSWSEARSGFGTLHVRALAETPAGELWIGAREGLFRIGLAERTMTRLHSSSVRAIAVADLGRVASGGETGLFVTQGGLTSSVPLEGLEKAWIDGIAFLDRRIHATTPLGLFAEGADGAVRRVLNGDHVGAIAAMGDRLFAASDSSDAALQWFTATGRWGVEQIPGAVRRVFAVGDRLFADTTAGLVERADDQWRVRSRRLQQESLGHAHVGAFASYRGRVVVGFFDGGLAELAPIPSPRAESFGVSPGDQPKMLLHPLVASPTAEVWAVNALLEAGGVLHVASLRGAFRFDGSRVTPVEGTGAAFSLAQTEGGVAIGYGEGLLLPERRLLSAFHGLPGNQATALVVTQGGILVGTPSGLGYVLDRKVRWRVASGEGKLPHPWVTAILPMEDAALIGTYGGGVARRVGAMSDPGVFQPFVETQGLKVNTGCLVIARGRVYAGTDGTGLYRLSVDGTRFERLKLSLPSERVTALFERDGFLYIGTDEGLTRWPVERDVQP